MTATQESTSDWIGTTVCAAACAWLSFVLVRHVSALTVEIAGLAVVAVGAALTLTDRRHVGLTVAVGGAVLAAVAVPFASGGALERGGWFAVVAAALVLAVGSARGFFPAAVLAAGSTLLLLVAWVLAFQFLATPIAAAVMGVLSVLMLGVVARGAVAAAGLTRLAVADGGGVRPTDLIGVTVVAAVSAGAAGAVLALVGGVWATILAVLVAVVVLLRARVMRPLAAQLCLASSGAAVLVALADRAADASSAGWLVAVVVAGLLAVGAIVGMVARPSKSIVDGVQRGADVAELGAVVAVVPVAVVLVLMA